MLTNLKRRSALLITLAVVCATVSLVPQTAGAAATKVANLGTSAASDPHTAPSAPEHMKACPGDSASAAGFTDTTSTDVDCIKMFGITTGKTATTYDPTGTISRQDMARYIHRMFTATGLAAAGAVAVPAFTDTAHVAADGLAAITALASHGITTGTTATTFSPDDNVTRAQMAAFLQRFAMLVKDHGGTALLKGDPAQVGTGTFNYADITNTTFEEMESIIWLYNLGVFGTCVVDSLGQCGGTTGGTTYRPADDITRAEMATMLVNLLNHTNARPAGVTIQASSASSTLAVGAVTTLISVRGADHSPTSNVLVDEFTQLHNDAAGVAAVAPFVTTLGSCTAGVTKTLGGTLCVVDATDPSTDIRGNANGTSQTTAAYKTANWWVHKGATGSTYVDGTTSDYDKLSIGFGAAATLVNATSAVISMPDIYAKTESLAAYTGITQTDGILTYAGQSRTFTVTLKPATATDTVKSGYSIKVATTTTDVAGNATQSVAYYAATSAVGGATASWTTTCPTSGVVAPSALYATAIEHRVSMGALLDADGLPTGVSVSPMDDDFVLAPAAGAFDADATTYSMGLANGQTAGTVGLTCQDHTRAYVDNATDETLAVSSNNYAYSTAGSLASVTATAYDQYGAGVAGATVAFQRVTTNSTAAGTTTAVTLTTAANGTATLSEVHCKTGGEIKSAWSVTDPSAGANLSMSAITAADPSTATAGEGTNIYCTTAGADGDTPLEQVTGVTGVVTVTLSDACADAGSGTLTLTFANARGLLADTTSTTEAFTEDALVNAAVDAADNVSIHHEISALANVPAATTTLAATSGDTCVLTFTFPAGTGKWTVTAASTLSAHATNADGSITATPGGVTGTAAIAFLFIDDDPTANFMITEHKITTAAATGASEATTKYNTWLYDSTDFLTLNAADDDIATTVTAASEAQFEAANALHNDLATHVTLTYRKTSAVTSGISLITVGT